MMREEGKGRMRREDDEVLRQVSREEFKIA